MLNNITHVQFPSSPSSSSSASRSSLSASSPSPWPKHFSLSSSSTSSSSLSLSSSSSSASRPSWSKWSPLPERSWLPRPLLPSLSSTGLEPSHPSPGDENYWCKNVGRRNHNLHPYDWWIKSHLYSLHFYSPLYSRFVKRWLRIICYHDDDYFLFCFVCQSLSCIFIFWVVFPDFDLYFCTCFLYFRFGFV